MYVYLSDAVLLAFSQLWFAFIWRLCFHSVLMCCLYFATISLVHFIVSCIHHHNCIYFCYKVIPNQKFWLAVPKRISNLIIWSNTFILHQFQNLIKLLLCTVRTPALKEHHLVLGNREICMLLEAIGQSLLQGSLNSLRWSHP